jgi:hypothetical protein
VRRLPGRVRLRRDGEPGESPGGGARRRLAPPDRLPEPGEIERVHLVEVGRDEDVLPAKRLDLPLDVLPGEETAGLHQDLQESVERVPLGERHRDVDGDDDLRPHLPHDIDRQVARDPAVDEEPAVQLHRRKEAGHRHARADRSRQVARAEDDGLTRLDVRGDGSEGDRKPVEVPDRRGGPRPSPEVVAEPLAGDQAGRNDELAAREAELDVDQVAGVVLLAPERAVLPRRDVGERAFPVDRPELFGHPLRRHPDRVERAGERPAARPGHEVDRDAELFQHLQDADERSPAGSASGERETDARACRRGRRRLLRGEGPHPGSQQDESRQGRPRCDHERLQYGQSTRGL